MKLKFSKEEMVLLNAICDIEASADGTKTYSMKPTVIDDEGCVCVEAVGAFKLMNEGFITTDMVDRRDDTSLSGIVNKLSELK